MQTIIRNFDGSPKIFEDSLEVGCQFENTLFPGFATLIVDEDFLNSMNEIKEQIKNDTNFISLLTNIQNKVCKYYTSTEVNDKSREKTYDSNSITDENGQVIGTKISSLSGKNVSQCSEKSLAAYAILNMLFKDGIITRKPSLVLSSLSTEKIKPGPHAFIMLNKDCDDMTKHLLFDVENSAYYVDEAGKKIPLIGLYTLNDKEYDDFIDGSTCTPTSIFEFYGYKEVSDKKTYGNFSSKNNIYFTHK